MLAFAQAHISSAVGHEEIGLDELLDQYAAYDISYSVSRSLLSTLAPSRANTPEDEAFYDFLRRSSLLPKSSAIRPAKLDLVEHLESAQGPKPNIFIFVVDSLRQDYLSPYNRAVTFTPEIEKFSHESIVMGNAFTRYGGTGLSEPSIWTGTMQLHEQYVQPFYSMNNLQKLVETDGYQPYVSVDQILKELIRPSPEIVELDKNVTWYRFDLADTLTELRQKIDLRRESNRPIFAFSQALNVHLMGVKTIQANESLAGEVPKGVDRQHAVQVRRVDRALGEFIQFLKTRGLYDNSIIVLTSDHGDSLGEEGHWGHINSLYPEIMRVPLIIHLPPDLQKSFVWDQSQVAFNTDIVPTLYYILGHRSILNDDLLGRPLLTETKEELQSYIRDNYLVASSYGPVYGLLSDNGRSLFVADAQQRQDFLYDLSTGFNGSHKRVSESARSNYRHEIHEYIEQINRRFNFTP